MATAVYRNSGTNRPFWLDLWQTECKYVDPTGRELGRVQAGEMTWVSYVGTVQLPSGRQDQATAKRLVEAAQDSVSKSKPDHD